MIDIHARREMPLVERGIGDAIGVRSRIDASLRPTCSDTGTSPY
jgi:hypothetical protein